MIMHLMLTAMMMMVMTMWSRWKPNDNFDIFTISDQKVKIKMVLAVIHQLMQYRRYGNSRDHCCRQPMVFKHPSGKKKLKWWSRQRTIVMYRWVLFTRISGYFPSWQPHPLHCPVRSKSFPVHLLNRLLPILWWTTTCGALVWGDIWWLNSELFDVVGILLQRCVSSGIRWGWVVGGVLGGYVGGVCWPWVVTVLKNSIKIR